MSTEPLRYFIEIGGRSFRVRDLDGEEGLSRPFRFSLSFALEDAPQSFDPDDLVKQSATLRLSREGTERAIDGVITEVTLSAAVRGAPEVTMILEPRLALLGYRRDIRVFRDQSVPEMVRDVAGALGVKVEMRLSETYEKRPYCVQLRETDLDYIHRLLEDEGIFYYLLEDDVMVLGDSPAAYDPVQGDPHFEFRAPSGQDMNEDAVIALGSRAGLVPGKVTLRDWNPEHPSLDMDAASPAPIGAVWGQGGGGSGGERPEWYDFPGEYLDPAGGARKARLHAEAFTVEAARLFGRSTTGRLAPGATFSVDGAPAGGDGKFVVTALTHSWHREDEGFDNGFEALPETVTYRPPRVTHVPQLMNPMTAFVTTNGQDIQTDPYGRVKVHFHWDRLWPYDDTCSHWVPVLQDNTGGSSAVPRRNWEVLVHFMEGDPDRPIVLGRVYNDEDPFPEKLPHAKTRSSLKSLGSPSRRGTNEIRFEDAAGQEHIFVHAEKDQNINIANNRTENVGNTETSVVKNDESITVGNDATITIGEDLNHSVAGNQKWSVSGTRKLTVGKGLSEDVGGDRQFSVSGNYEREIGFDDAASANDLDEQITGSVMEKFREGALTQSGETMKITVGGSVLEIAGQSKVESTSVERTEKIEGMSLAMSGGDMKTRVNQTRTTNVKGSLTVKATKELALTGAEKITIQTNTTAFNAATDVIMKVGDTEVSLKDGLIRVKCNDTISMVVSGTNTQGASKSTQI